MALNPYYEDELSYLRELGADFALANPKLAPFLGQDATDPDVERLLEGFAFLVARLRQKLDDEFPEFVHGLLRMVWPQYLQALPPITTLSFALKSSASAASLNVPAGTSVRSRPIEGTNCTFVTCYPIDVLPLEMIDVQLENRTSSARLTLDIKATGQQNLSCLKKGRLRLFFSTEREPQVGRCLLAWLCRHASQGTVSVADRQVAAIGSAQIAPVGFSDDEAVLPWPHNAFSGFRIIQEYLSYPSKFLYVELSGLEPLAGHTETECRLTFEFRRPFPAQLRVGKGQICLNCTPAINVFSHEASPIRLNRTKTEYRVLASGGPNFTIRSVDDVTGYVQGRPERIEFEPFDLLRHDLPGAERNRAYFRERIRPAVVGRGVDHYVSFVDRLDIGQHPPIDVASLQLTCSNGPIADRLPIGSVDLPTSDTPRSVTFSNITAVVAEVPPPVSDGLLRRLTANLARNYGAMANVDALRTVLASYEFRAVYDVQARRRLELLLEGLDQFVSTDTDHVVRGAPIRMRNIEMAVIDSKIGGESELFLLGAVLDAFFATFAGINMLHRFSVRGTESNAHYLWPARSGSMTAL
ncbi:type VI secretion system protein ImpG [Bradyrhizobium sp. USDA 4532]|uniref:type VI secretion system baseplate subunit TssF n=1 Tax=unclassified Bradyrhizobium TaxID=2631580 RepID=UPI00209F3EB4|nr:MULTISPECIES: type VI secretion system baseplate subunit TssF [unclassified Bradyrhizobium]MCP1835403.1 type VI secretion system protein ImpG [Bradyrhizobium sp. USDA 4545]MCP1920149.1 type VI secretion system protein ImpG [Bradyrhizobium sp. USDA 4532]